MSLSKRFLLYAQHLSGTGHFVRTYEIACALGEGNEVYLVDGGRSVPRQYETAPFKLIPLPRIYRSQKSIIPLDSRENIKEIMEQRKQLLLKSVAQIRPDVVLIEHFPFSKWELYQEIIPMIELAQRVNKNVKIICSLRDITGRMRHDSNGEQHHLKVVETLHQYFHGILVHADPKLVRLEEYISWVEQITIKIEYTGYVSQKVSPNPVSINSSQLQDSGIILVSAGGAGSIDLISHCIAAWKHPSLQNFINNHQLIIFTPLFAAEDELKYLKKYMENKQIQIHPFSADFLDYMQAATLSISQAGYNTCTNILETRTPAILIPNSTMSDQLPRAHLLAGRGLVTIMDGDNLNPSKLSSTIIDALSRPIIKHNIDLDGARKTRKILEKI